MKEFFSVISQRNTMFRRESPFSEGGKKSTNFREHETSQDCWKDAKQKQEPQGGKRTVLPGKGGSAGMPRRSSED